MQKKPTLKAVCFLSFTLFLSAWIYEKKVGPNPPKILRNGQLQDLSLGTLLQNDDTLIVGKKEKVLLTEGNSKTWVGSNTVIKIANLLSNEKGQMLLEPEKSEFKFSPTKPKNGLGMVLSTGQ